MMEASSHRMQLLGQAQASLRRGDLRAAIKTFKQLVEQFPDDYRIQLKLAELLREDGQFHAALWTCGEVARHWERSGFLLKAIDIYRWMTELDPTHVRAHRKMAELYVELHLPERARATYLHLASAFAASGQQARRLAMAQRALTLAPEDVETRLAVADACEALGKTSECVAQLVAAADLLERDEDWGQFILVARRCLAFSPEDDERRAALARAEALLATGSAGAPVLPHRPRPRVEAEDVEAVCDVTTQGLRPPAGLRTQVVEARPGIPSAFGLRSFGPSAEVLLLAPEHPVAAAIRARRRGEVAQVFGGLLSEAAERFPVAVAMELGLACLALQQYGDAFMHLSTLMDEPTLSDEDRALVAYHLGLAAEALGDEELARASFERVEALVPGEAADVPLRLARVRVLDQG